MSTDSPRDNPPAEFVTEEEAAESLSIIERLMARFSIDDDYFAAFLANQATLGRAVRELRHVVDELVSQRDEGVEGKFVIDMSHNIPADTTLTDPLLTERQPDLQNDARVTGVSLGWQDGTNNKVGIQLRTGNGQKLLPRNPEDEYLAFNDFSETFDLLYRLRPGETLVAQTVNLDASNPHFVNIVPQIEELPAGTENDKATGGEGGE